MIPNYEVGGWLVWVKKLTCTTVTHYPIVKVTQHEVTVTYGSVEYSYAKNALRTFHVQYVAPNEDIDQKILFLRLKYSDREE
jgi:hypothetical protein